MNIGSDLTDGIFVPPVRSIAPFNQFKSYNTSCKFLSISLRNYNFCIFEEKIVLYITWFSIPIVNWCVLRYLYWLNFYPIFTSSNSWHTKNGQNQKGYESLHRLLFMIVQVKSIAHYIHERIVDSVLFLVAIQVDYGIIQVDIQNRDTKRSHKCQEIRRSQGNNSFEAGTENISSALGKRTLFVFFHLLDRVQNVARNYFLCFFTEFHFFLGFDCAFWLLPVSLNQSSIDLSSTL